MQKFAPLKISCHTIAVEHCVYSPWHNKWQTHESRVDISQMRKENVLVVPKYYQGHGQTFCRTKNANTANLWRLETSPPTIQAQEGAKLQRITWQTQDTRFLVWYPSSESRLGYPKIWKSDLGDGIVGYHLMTSTGVHFPACFSAHFTPIWLVLLFVFAAHVFQLTSLLSGSFASSLRTFFSSLHYLACLLVCFFVFRFAAFHFNSRWSPGTF